MAWVAVASAAITVGGKLIAGNQQKNAIDKATDTYKQGAQQGAQILDKGYDDARDAKLDALHEIGAISDKQFIDAKKAIADGHDAYVNEIVAAGEGYTAKVQGASDAYKNALYAAAPAYRDALNEYAGTYGDEITALASQLGVDINTAAGIFKQQLEQSAGKYAGELNQGAATEQTGLTQGAEEYAGTKKQGLAAITSALQPYQEGQGTPALDLLNKQVQQDPTQLDPNQKLVREKYLRDSSARLAASGLRGAGRAGVAAVNSGDAELAAGFYGQNRDRATSAAGTLANYGYGASGQIGQAGQQTYSDIAGNTQTAKASGLDIVRSAGATGSTYGANARAAGISAVSSAADRAATARATAAQAAADAKKAAADKAADTGLGLWKEGASNDQANALKIAGVNLDIGTKKADNAVKTADDTRTEINADATRRAGIADKTGQANSDAITGKASADAGAVADPAYIAAQAALAKGNINADTTGSITSSVSDIIKNYTSGGLKDKP